MPHIVLLETSLRQRLGGGAQVTSGAVTVGRQKLFHQHVLNSSPLKMQISSGSPTTTICSALPHLPWLASPT